MEFRVEIGQIRRDRERDNTDIGDSDTDTLRPGGRCNLLAPSGAQGAPSVCLSVTVIVCL